MVIGKEVIQFNDNLYMVEKRWKENTIKSDKVDELRQELQCDIVLRKDGRLHFCTIVKDAEIVTDDEIKTEIVN